LDACDPLSRDSPSGFAVASRHVGVSLARRSDAA
jgi:hypothetical protein